MSDNAHNKSYEQADADFHRLVAEFQEHVEQQRQQQRPRPPDVQQQSNQHSQQRQQQQPAQHQIVVTHQQQMQQMQAMMRQQAMMMQAAMQRQQQQERPAPPEPTFTDLKEQVLSNIRFLYPADQASSVMFDVITSDDIPTPDPGPSVNTYPTTAFVTKQGGIGLPRWILKSNPARTAYYAVLDLFLMTNKLINDQPKTGPEVGVSDAKGRLYEAVGLHNAVRVEEE